jgi:hypothetical protein
VGKAMNIIYQLGIAMFDYLNTNRNIENSAVSEGI